MRLFLLFALAFNTALLVAQEARVEEIGKSPVEAKFAPGGQVRLQLCSSGVDVLGKEDGMLRVSYVTRHENDDDVRIRIRVRGDEAALKVAGCPHNNFRMTIEVPRSSSLHVRMFAGELNIRDVTGDKDVELHFGQLTMDIGDPSNYARVEASVSSGDLEARSFDVSKGGLFRSFARTGPGKYRLYAHVGAGELDLR